jgi:4-hydroxy-3-methylbut-2-enyl diphosphate reductase
VEHPLWTPGTPLRGLAALGALRRAVPALAGWAAAADARDVLVTGPGRAGAELAGCDLVLVLGPAPASDAPESAAPAGAPTYRVPTYRVADVADVELTALAGAGRVGVVVAESAAPQLTGAVLRALAGLGPVRVRAVRDADERVRALAENVHTSEENVVSTVPREVS